VRRHRRLPTEPARVIQGCLEMRASDRPAVMEVSRILDRFAERQLNEAVAWRAEISAGSAGKRRRV
jgi:hypothetical protein